MSTETICYCFEVTKQEILDIIHKHKVKSVEDIQKHCQASMGCGSCRFDIEKIIEGELEAEKK